MYSICFVEFRCSTEGSIPLLYTGVSVNPAKAWGNLANVLNNQGKTGEAENAYRNALSHRSNMADVHYNLGILLQVCLVLLVDRVLESVLVL